MCSFPPVPHRKQNTSKLLLRDLDFEQIASAGPRFRASCVCGTLTSSKLLLRDLDFEQVAFAGPRPPFPKPAVLHMFAFALQTLRRIVWANNVPDYSRRCLISRSLCFPSGKLLQDTSAQPTRLKHSFTSVFTMQMRAGSLSCRNNAPDYSRRGLVSKTRIPIGKVT